MGGQHIHLSNQSVFQISYDYHDDDESYDYISGTYSLRKLVYSPDMSLSGVSRLEFMTLLKNCELHCRLCNHYNYLITLEFLGEIR